MKAPGRAVGRMAGKFALGARWGRKAGTTANAEGRCHARLSDTAGPFLPSVFVYFPPEPPPSHPALVFPAVADLPCREMPPFPFPQTCCSLWIALPAVLTLPIKKLLPRTLAANDMFPNSLPEHTSQKLPRPDISQLPESSQMIRTLQKPLLAIAKPWCPLIFQPPLKIRTRHAIISQQL